MVFKLSPAAEAEIYWSEHRKHLDKLIEEKDELILAISSSTATGEIYTKIENCFKAAERIRSYDNGIPFHRAKKLEQAESAVREVKRELHKQFAGYNSLESKIRGEVERWHANGENSKLYGEILADCTNYKNIERIARLLEVGRINDFYLEMAGVSELLSPTSYTAIVFQYASSNTKEELQLAQQNLGKSIWQKVEAEKERLLQKYRGKLSEAEKEFVKALPGKKWRELDAEMSKVVAHAEEYLGKKREVEKEIKAVKSQTQALSEMEGKLNTKTISAVEAVVISKKHFDNGGTIYLNAGIRSYFEWTQEVLMWKNQRTKELSRLFSVEYHQLTESFDGESKWGEELLRKYLTRAGELRDYGERLKEKVIVAAITDFEDKVKRFGEYLNLTKNPAPLPKIIVNIPLKEKKEACSAVGPSPVPLATPTPLEAVPDTKVALSSAVNYPTESPFFPLTTEMDLTLFAFNYLKESLDPRMREFCQQISGFNEKGEFTTTKSLAQRVAGISAKTPEELETTLSGSDALAYRHLCKSVKEICCRA